MLLIDAPRYEKYASIASARLQTYKDEAVIQAAEHTDIRMVGSDALIPVVGPVTYKYDFWAWLFGGTSCQVLQSQLRAADSNNQVSRVILYMDTPGGEITGVPETARMIAKMSKEVIAVVDPCCASAGLWLASQAKRIVCSESGEIGSLGVQVGYRSYAEYFKQNGIDVKVFRAAISPDKNIGHPHEVYSEQVGEHLQSLVDKWGEQFLATVASGRGKTKEYALEHFGKGKMFYGAEAVEVGLADSVGTLEDVLAEQPRSTKKIRASLHRKAVNAYRAS